MLGFLFLLFIGKTLCSTEYFSNLNSLINGPLPVFDLSKFVKDTHNDVPLIVLNATANLDSCKTCKLDIIDGSRFTASTDNKYRRYVEDGTMPAFEDHYEAGQILMRAIQNLEFYLIDEEMMRSLDGIHVKVMEAKDMTQQVELDAYRQVFDRVGHGKALLQHLLAFFARLVEKGTMDDGYMQVSSIIAKHIAKEFFSCSWMYRCSEISRDATISLVLKLGSQNIPKIVVLYPNEEGDHVHSGESNIHEGVLQGSHTGYVEVGQHEPMLEHGVTKEIENGYEHYPEHSFGYSHHEVHTYSPEHFHHLRHPHRHAHFHHMGHPHHHGRFHHPGYYYHHEHTDELGHYDYDDEAFDSQDQLMAEPGYRHMDKSQSVPTFGFLHEAIVRLSEQLESLHHKHTANFEAADEEPYEYEPYSYDAEEHDGYGRDYSSPHWHHHSPMGDHRGVHHVQ